MAKIQYERVEHNDGEISYHRSICELRASGKSIKKIRMSGFCARLPIPGYASKAKKMVVTKQEYYEAYAKRVTW